MIIYTGGTFDLFHLGHVRLLKQCKDVVGENGTVVVSLNTDEFVLQFKGKTPVCSYEERAEVLEACRYVDRVIPNSNGQDSKPAILSVAPQFVAVGSDWAPPKDYFKQMQFTQEWLDENSIKLVFLTRTEGISSTEIQSRMSD